MPPFNRRGVTRSRVGLTMPDTRARYVSSRTASLGLGRPPKSFPVSLPHAVYRRRQWVCRSRARCACRVPGDVPGNVAKHGAATLQAVIRSEDDVAAGVEDLQQRLDVVPDSRKGDSTRFPVTRSSPEAGTRARSIPRPKICEHFQTPSRLTEWTWLHASMETSRPSFSRAIPALLPRMSTGRASPRSAQGRARAAPGQRRGLRQNGAHGVDRSWGATGPSLALRLEVEPA
jgi:hypothetical protein